MIVLRSYKIKLKPNKQQLHKLNEYFYEAKCLYNFVLSSENVFKFDTKIKNIIKLNKDKQQIPIILNNLSSKLKQKIIYSIQNNIKNLSKKKKKGNKVGKLKYKSEINYIDLDNQCFNVKNNKIRLTGFGRNTFKCRGLKQLKDIIKTRNAKLIKECNNYYICICCEKEINHIDTNKEIGIDMGIENNIILSNGEKLNYSIGESEQSKKLQKKVSKSKKGSNNRKKLCLKLQKANIKTINKKKEFVNQLIHKLDTNYDLIVWQDELISKWKKSKMKGFGKKLQHSCLGMFKLKLQQHMNENPNRYIQLDSKYPTTQLCPKCGTLNKHTLDKRLYQCECGYSCDRDIHSAKNMLIFAKNLVVKIPQELGEIKAYGDKNQYS